MSFSKWTLFALLFCLTSCRNGSISSFWSKIFQEPKKPPSTTLETKPQIDTKQQTAFKMAKAGDISGALEAYVSPGTPPCPAALGAQQKQKQEAPPSTHDQCEERYNGQKVLYIGDSHSYLRSSQGNRMGNKINDRLYECGAQSVEYRGICGSRPANWLPGKSPKTGCGASSMGPGRFSTTTRGSSQNLDQLIQDHTPDNIIINLGDNMFSWSKKKGKHVASLNSNKASEEVQKLIETIPVQKACTWIGPTYHSPGSTYSKPNSAVDKLYEAIKKGNQGRCKIIDGRSYFSQTAPNDGLHLTSKESTEWGRRIAQDL